VFNKLVNQRIIFQTDCSPFYVPRARRATNVVKIEKEKDPKILPALIALLHKYLRQNERQKARIYLLY